MMKAPLMTFESMSLFSIFIRKQHPESTTETRKRGENQTWYFASTLRHSLCPRASVVEYFFLSCVSCVALPSLRIRDAPRHFRLFLPDRPVPEHPVHEH